MSYLVWNNLLGMTITNHLLKLLGSKTSIVSFESCNLWLNALHLQSQTQQPIKNKFKQTTRDESSTDLGMQAIQPPAFLHSGLSRIVWKLWNLFDELTIRRGILCQKHEKLKNIQIVFQKVVPPTWVQDILQSLLPDITDALRGSTITVGIVGSHLCWSDHKLDVELFRCQFVCQKRNKPSNIHIQSIRAWQPKIPFSTVGIDFLGPLHP